MLGPRRRLGCPPVPAGRTKRVVRRYYEDVLVARRLDVLHGMLAPEFVAHDSSGATIDRFGYIAGVQVLLSAFADLSVYIDDQIAESDRVTTRWSAVARHVGSYAGVPPSGREVLMAGTDIHRIDGDRVEEVWEQVDFAGLLAQLL
jgi:predicted ester cyclase